MLDRIAEYCLVSNVIFFYVATLRLMGARVGFVENLMEKMRCSPDITIG